MSYTKKTIEQAFRTGKLKTSVANVERITSRSLDRKTGKVYTGDAGRNLQRRKQEKQAYFERNK